MNGDGHIDVSEIQTVMGNLGYPKSDAEAKKIAEQFDVDGNGTIEFDEFVGMIAGRMLKSDGTAELQMAFSTLFDDASGCARADQPRQTHEPRSTTPRAQPPPLVSTRARLTPHTLTEFSLARSRLCVSQLRAPGRATEALLRVRQPQIERRRAAANTQNAGRG